MSPIHIGICRLSNMCPGGAEKRTMALAEHFAQHDAVTLITPDMTDWQAQQHFFCIDLSKVNVCVLRPLSPYFRHLLRLRSSWSQILHRVATLSSYIRQIRALRLDLFINSSPDMTLPPLASHNIYMCTFPARVLPPPKSTTVWPGKQRIRDIVEHWLKRICCGSTNEHPLADYDIITANSHFTQQWIQQRWGLPATVVYSACEMIQARQPKEKVICHAGRFVDHANKKASIKRQDLLIEAFKNLPDLHQAGWQLHLAGGLRKHHPYDQAYLVQLQAASQGYPIFFHANAPLTALHDLYQRASIYWHATGYGTDAQHYPERQEHFGMTTVEAMSAGAVPVVLNTGGQAEIVAHGVNGFVWEQLSELVAHTRCLANDPALRATMSQKASADSQQYSKSNFLARMDTIVDQVLADVRYHPP